MGIIVRLFIMHCRKNKAGKASFFALFGGLRRRCEKAKSLAAAFIYK